MTPLDQLRINIILRIVEMLNEVDKMFAALKAIT